VVAHVVPIGGESFGGPVGPVIPLRERADAEPGQRGQLVAAGQLDE